MILPIIVIIFLLLGVVLICKYCVKKNEKEKRRFKLGLIFFILSIGTMALSILIMSINSNLLEDACGSIAPIYSVIKSLFNIMRIIIPFGLIIGDVIFVIRILFTKNNAVKKELKTKIAEYIILALLIFIIMTIVSVCLGIFITVPESQISTCWC